MLVSGTIRGTGGAPLEGARVYFTSGPGPFPDIAAVTGPDGSFTLSAPTPGTYEVEGAAEGYLPQCETVEVVEGDAEARLDFRLGTV